jgi:hypothetical protein
MSHRFSQQSSLILKKLLRDRGPLHHSLLLTPIWLGWELACSVSSRLSDAENITGFVFQDMVAKETKYNERIEERFWFHKCFAETQDLASFLAIEFN